MIWYPAVVDQNGQLASWAAGTGSWQYRRIDLTPIAGHTINNAYMEIITKADGQPWHVYYNDVVVQWADGTVHPLYTRESSLATFQFGTGQTNPTTVVDISTATADVNNPAQTTYYYHGDHLGTSRLMTSGGGWPVWQGIFLPYGKEYNAQMGTNHYKFTGKERDDESGLDFFGARYYGSSSGRWMSPDWSAKQEPVPYAKLNNPQSMNLYAYVGNSPLIRIDRDGHEWQFNGNDKVTKEQVQKAFEAGVKSQGAPAWHAYEAIGKAKGIVSVGLGDLKNDKAFGDTKFHYTSHNGKLTSVSGSITINANEKALNILNSTDLATASSHEFTHVESALADPKGGLGGGLNNLAPHGGFAEEAAAFRNQDATASAIAATPGNSPLSPNTSLSNSVEQTTGKTDAQMYDLLTSYGYHFDEAKPK